jgi:hypothetical protein
MRRPGDAVVLACGAVHAIGIQSMHLARLHHVRVHATNQCGMSCCATTQASSRDASRYFLPTCQLFVNLKVRLHRLQNFACNAMREGMMRYKAV